MSRFRTSLMLLLVLATSAHGIGMREGGKYADHGKFTHPKSMWVLITFNQGGGSLTKTHAYQPFSFHRTDDGPYDSPGNDQDGTGDFQGLAHTGGTRPSNKWYMWGISGNYFDTTSRMLTGDYTAGYWFNMAHNPNGAWSRNWLLCTRNASYKYAVNLIVQSDGGGNYVSTFLRDNNGYDPVDWGEPTANTQVYYANNEPNHICSQWDESALTVDGIHNGTNACQYTFPSWGGWYSGGQWAWVMFSDPSTEGYLDTGSWMDEVFVVREKWTTQQINLWKTRGRH